MALAEALTEIAQGLADGVVHLVENAGTDIANTYQAVLMQDAGWRVHAGASHTTQQIAEQLAKDQLGYSADLEHQIEI